MKRAIALLLLLGAAAMLALNLPGQLSYDSVSQLYQGRTGIYDSWHPPVMAWLLGLFDAAGSGPALFVLLNAVLLAGSWGLLLHLAKAADWRALALLFLMLLTPQFLLYQGTVWKDVLFADAAIAGFAALAAFAVARDWRWLAAFVILLSLAALTRQNGILLLPIGAIFLGWIARRQGRGGFRAAAAMLGLALLLTAGAGEVLSLRGDKGAGADAEIRRAQAYDLIGALVRAPDLALPALDQKDPALAALMRHDGVRLYSPRLNDTLEQSPALKNAIEAAPAGLVFSQWENLWLAHPGLYLAQRWPVFVWVLATPDVAQCHPAFVGIEGDPAQLRALGLTPRIRPQDHLLAVYTMALMGTPVLSHLTFLVLALLLLAALLRRRALPDLAIAGMLVGALAVTASYFVISIACDYRYLDFLDLAAMTAAFYWCLSGTQSAKNLRGRSGAFSS